MRECQGAVPRRSPKGSTSGRLTRYDTSQTSWPETMQTRRSNNIHGLRTLRPRHGTETAPVLIRSCPRRIPKLRPEAKLRTTSKTLKLTPSRCGHGMNWQMLLPGSRRPQLSEISSQLRHGSGLTWRSDLCRGSRGNSAPST